MASDPKRVQEVFLAVVERQAADRAAFLNEQCSGDAELRERVEELLAAHEASGSFLNEPRLEVGQTVDSKFKPERPGAAEEQGSAGDNVLLQSTGTTDYRPKTEPGAVIGGRYSLQEKIGEGGMGEVWVAKQTEPVKRRVALKLIKTGMDSKAVVTRFEQERQALAMMDHPNIARVLDGGMTPSGQPFFVMELVNGLPLTKFCDEAKLTLRQRLELYLPICQAVQHAHQKGIIHRDLKPANILITLIDGRPVPKVIDFGVAKATAGKLTDESMSTQFGAVVGTLEYMSPEQAGFSGIDIDTRTDIYSLGVILYELLTGLRPIDANRLRKAAIAEMIRMIQEEEPSKPSTRLSTDESLQSLAALRQTEPRKLMALLRGELDWVVMKCLEKQRDRRYETASGLARDIERYLADEPVEARPPSAAYRLGKFLRRHKGPAMATALLLLALVAGIAGTTRGMLAAREALRAEAEQRNIAQREAKEKEQARAAAEEAKNQEERARAAAEKALYFNRVNLADQYWQANNVVESRRILDLCPPQSHGWEWRYLDRLHRADLLTLPGNGQFTTELHMSKDGRRLAAFSPYGDGGVRIWDLDRGKSLAEIKAAIAHRPFTCCAICPDGRSIALGEQSGAITIWDAATGKKTRDFAKMPRSVSWLSFSPDGRRLASARADSRNGEMLIPAFEPPRHEDLVVWEVASGAEVFHPKGFGFVAAFSPDGTRLLTFKMNAAFRLFPQTPETFVALFDTSNWKEVDPGQLGWATSFAFSADGQKLALGGLDRVKGAPFVRIVDAATAAELTVLLPTARPINFDVAISPDGSMLAMTKGLESSEIEIWDVKTRRQVRALRGHTESVNNVAFTPQGKLLSCSRDRTIKIWDPASDPEVRQVVAPKALRADPALLARGGQLLAYSQPNTVSLLTGHFRDITLVDCGTQRRTPSAAGSIIAALGSARDVSEYTDDPPTGGIFSALRLALLGVETGQAMHTLDGNAGGVVALAISDNGQRLASGGRTGDVKTWDLTVRDELAMYRGHKGKITALAILPDGRRVASAHEPAEIARWYERGGFPQTPVPVAVKVWDAESGQELFSLEGHVDGVYQLAFSPDGRWLASAGNLPIGNMPGLYQGIRIWDMANGKPLGELNHNELQSGTTDALTFSPRGNLLATAGGQIVQLWDAATRRSVAVFRGHKTGKLMVAISPDQSRLASAAGQQVKIWDIESGLEALSLPLPQVNPQERAADVVALVWSADGQRLRAALNNGAVVEWDGTPPADFQM